MNANLITILSEIALSLHPILIKNVNTTLPTQLFARISIYSILAAAFAGPKDWTASWGSSNIVNSLLFGIMNLIHIGSSYISYQNLPAGTALAIFYIYPFFNILAGVLFLGESISLKIIPLMILAFVGVLLISKYTKVESAKDDTNKTPIQYNILLGISAALISAITETFIFLIAKTGSEPTPWLPILRLYPGALLALLGSFAINKTHIDTRISTWIPLALFNIFIGFIGYSLRFFSIPRLSTEVFSILTFIGVSSGYFWGLLFANEVPSIGAILGALCITGSVGILRIL